MMQAPNIQTLGHTLSLTMKKARQELCQTAETRFSSLVCVQSGDPTNAPMFCFPGAGASVTSFRDLAASLPGRQPVYGFEPRGLDGALLPFSTVAAATEVNARQFYDMYGRYREKSITLVGHSFGGWLAFEMARQLTQSAQSVATVTIIDTEVPDSSADTVREYSNVDLLVELIGMFEQVLGRSLGVERSDIDRLNEAEQRRLLHAKLLDAGLISRYSHIDVLVGPMRTFARALRTRFCPNGTYSGIVQLVLVNDSRLEPEANLQRWYALANGWRRFAPNLVVREMPGNHMTVLRQPFVGKLAQLIAGGLSQ
jgi:arthrofactin-type cyclic lipopeptide synthetase C